MGIELDQQFLKKMPKVVFFLLSGLLSLFLELDQVCNIVQGAGIRLGCSDLVGTLTELYLTAIFTTLQQPIK